MADRREAHVATGKRKSAVARVRLLPGDGKITVNARALDDYFGRETSRMIVNQPFDVTETRGQYDASVKVGGGGVAAQATAIRHGITRDPREVERKKYGRHKARKRPQYSKR